ncbi:DUF6876 family protein [Sinomicrobium soli]|uniref:DUF6876 family protein n=1 Tax=Sinomicrobium sp. N-1-3-6 TaxID=2219864 RepID=UPI000DCDC35C|nr:DUF6876 family protein [Sinomicrobium sp. N-1-3-6]RAV29236.1 hypothetical protein DN748_09985 [Sinomicrobium sp. N-1-3-6]
MNIKAKKISEELKHFTGSETFYTLQLFNARYTEGVQYLVDKAGCFWLVIDICAVCVSPLNPHSFACITLNLWNEQEQKEKGCVATLTYDDGNGNVFYTANYAYTDFPLPHIKFYFTDRTLLLPSEY